MPFQQSSGLNAQGSMDGRPLLEKHGLSESSVCAEGLRDRAITTRYSRRRAHSIVLVVSLFINILLLIGLAYITYLTDLQNPNIFWTPFSSKLKYHVRVFDSGFREGITPYQAPPSPQTDDLWRGLYVEAFTVPKDVAAKQVNKTVPVNDEPDAEYITSFSVMHYLHCLNMVRQMTDMFYYPAYYNISSSYNPFTEGEEWEDFQSGGMFERKHISHCIDSLRQSMMCNPDLGPVVWQWVPEDNNVKVFAETAHTCANFDEILEYAKEREWPGDFVQDKDLGAVGQCGYYDEGCGYKAQESGTIKS